MISEPDFKLAVLFVDDENTFADAMRFAIDREPDMECIGTAHSAAEAVAAIDRHRPDHCLLNLDIHADDGFGILRAIKERTPKLPVTVLTSCTDAAAVLMAEAAGANHLVPDRSSMSDVLDAVRSPSNGHMTVPGSMLVDLMGHRSQPERRHGLDGLTARELDVLEGMAAGDPPKVIARAMGISIHTVRGHVKNIYWKLDAHNQLEAVAIARRRGLLARAG